MFRIDADAHVDETEDTWEYIEPSESRFKPVSVEPATAASRLRASSPGAAVTTRPREFRPPPSDGWLVDGEIYRRPVRDYPRTGTTAATSQLLDVDARVRHLDELRIDVQVLYPTTFINASFIGRPEVELALARSYSRWIAARTDQTHGRLRWVAVLPLLTMDKALEELRWAKDHGACGVFKKGVECGGRAVDDPYFFPLYEKASRLDIPMCIHTGTEGPVPSLRAADPITAVMAFEPLMASGVMQQFPALRVGFIEASASWVPFSLSRRLAGLNRQAHRPLDAKQLDLFRPNRIYVACQSQDDLPYILQFGTEDSLLVGTDYTHADASAELRALDIVEQRGASGEIPAEVARKILEDNPRRFYGI